MAKKGKAPQLPAQGNTRPMMEADAVKQGLQRYRTRRSFDEVRADVDRHPDDPDKLAELAFAAIDQGWWESNAQLARESAERAVELAPDHCVAWTSQGYVMMQGDEPRLDRAVEALKRAAEADPFAPYPHYLLSQVYQKLGHHIQAAKEKSTFDRLVRKESFNIRTDKRKIQILKKGGDPDGLFPAGVPKVPWWVQFWGLKINVPAALLFGMVGYSVSGALPGLATAAVVLVLLSLRDMWVSK